MSMQYIRDYYKVPAKRGARIHWTGGDTFLSPAIKDGHVDGTIVASKGQYIRVRFDGCKRIHTLHPTWKVEYLGGAR